MLNLSFSKFQSILSFGTLYTVVKRCVETGVYEVHYSKCPRITPKIASWGLCTKGAKGWIIFDPEACIEFAQLYEATEYAGQSVKKEEYISPLPEYIPLEYNPQRDIGLSLRNGQPRKWPR